MKISKSKQELARIISENGGWASDERFAAQDACGTVNSYECKPVFSAGNSGFGHGGGRFNEMFKAKKITNWHKTILSRAEYFHLYPAPDADGWIEWGGGECPVGIDVMLDVKNKSGESFHGVKAGRVICTHDQCWTGRAGERNIIAYRLHKPEQSLSSTIGREKFANGEIDTGRPATAKPTIEQLAADYRNAKDYADRKQQEADAANTDAEVKLKALELAGEALGPLVSLITAKQEPELVITNWRDLKVGDEVEYLAGSLDYMTGRVGVVCEFDESHPTSKVRIASEFINKYHQAWPAKWRFIRRP